MKTVTVAFKREIKSGPLQGAVVNSIQRHVSLDEAAAMLACQPIERRVYGGQLVKDHQFRVLCDTPLLN
jgi:hypothetical protein